jgi:hypothetical protein
MNKSKLAFEMIPESFNHQSPCVYFLRNKGKVVYVGKTINLRSRIASHINDKEFDSLSLIECEKQDMDRLEIEQIELLKPIYNKKDNPDYKKPKQIIQDLDNFSEELRAIIQDASKDQGIKGVMKLSELVKKEKGLSYERVSRVWSGSTSAKLSDVADIADVLGLKIKFIALGED